jgi:hypothetical protein
MAVKQLAGQVFEFQKKKEEKKAKNRFYLSWNHHFSFGASCHPCGVRRLVGVEPVVSPAGAGSTTGYDASKPLACWAFVDWMIAAKMKSWI